MDTKKRTYNFAIEIIKFIDKLPKDATSQIISKQLLRASTSIGTNVIEAHASPSRKDFTNFFNHSLKSANETVYWLELLRDSNKADKNETNCLLLEAKEIANILGSSLLTLRGRRKF